MRLLAGDVGTDAGVDAARAAAATALTRQVSSAERCTALSLAAEGGHAALVPMLAASLDSQPTQTQRRISEMFSPILSRMQQKDSEAHQLTMAQERTEGVEKGGGECQKKNEIALNSLKSLLTMMAIPPKICSRMPMPPRSASCVRP